MKTKTSDAITISKPEWDDYYGTQMAGTMNMFGHWNIRKFAPKGNWQKAYDHFVDRNESSPLVIEG
jgi:hypothetical protein